MGVFQTKQAEKFYQIVWIVGILLIAFNLRPAITSVGPLIGIIRDDLGLSNWSVGFVTSLPLLAFAIMSPLVPRMGLKFTNERMLLWGLVLLFIGICIRSTAYIVTLFIGTLLVGIGIAICNVLLPGVVKDKYSTKVGLMTSVYSTAMGIFAAAASGFSIPLASGLNIGWKLALLIWSIPAIIGIFIWFHLSQENNDRNIIEIKYMSSSRQMWQSPLAWQVAFYMGLQSFLFYVTISWMPEILHANNGVSMATAGWMLSILQFIGLPASFIVPVLADRIPSQRMIVMFLSISAIGGFSGLMFGNSYLLLIISIVLLGISLSGTFALALSFLGMRATSAKEAAELSGMAQSVGYILAAIGPVFIGYLHDITNSWTLPLITLIIVSLFILFFGLGAARNKSVFE